MSQIQDQVFHYGQIVALQLYSLITAITFHLTSVTANVVSQYPEISISVIGITLLIISIYLVKNLFIFMVKSIIQLIKLMSVMSFVVLGIVIYFRGLEFFTVDLVNLYNLVAKDVKHGTVYSDQIIGNVENIYQQALTNGENFESNNKYLQYVLSKTDYYKKLLNLSF